MEKSAKKINLQKVVLDLISKLPEKQQDILVKRFGLSDGRRRTLEEIGQGYGITRERVRQIENDAKASLLKFEEMSKLDPFFDEVFLHIESHGGLRPESHLLSRDMRHFFPKNADDKNVESFMYFVLSISDRFSKHPESLDFHSTWSVSKPSVQMVKKSIEALIKKLNERGETISKSELLKMFSEFMVDVDDEKVLNSHLSISKNIASNIYNDYGLKHWPEISTKGVRDKAYLVLKKEGEPLHFRVVVDKINDKFNLSKKAHPQTVHNELIKDNKFVLVGRGTYALSEWGYKPGTVSDVLVRILKDSKKPMTKEEIVKAVLKERDVQESTISLNLQNSKNFEKIEGGKYTFRA